MTATVMHRVVIVGGGFGGLSAAQALRRAPVEVTLIDRCNYHLFQPLLYQVATGALSPGDIATPLRSALRRQLNARVLLDEVIAVDVDARVVRLQRGPPVPYDTLVIAAGLTHNYFGHEEWAPRAPGLKNLGDAVDIRSRVLEAFESAERESDAAARGPYLNFVVVGAGPTGVELAGALAELAHTSLRGEFRTFDPRSSRVALIEGAPRVLPAFPAALSVRAQRSLERLGVDVFTQTRVTASSSSVISRAYCIAGSRSRRWRPRRYSKGATWRA
jgi:NADH dehydrogenase